MIVGYIYKLFIWIRTHLFLYFMFVSYFVSDKIRQWNWGQNRLNWPNLCKAKEENRIFSVITCNLRYIVRLRLDRTLLYINVYNINMDFFGCFTCVLVLLDLKRSVATFWQHPALQCSSVFTQVSSSKVFCDFLNTRGEM